ncbi:MAG: hypothetical protein V7679_03490 [Parasphingorhabdus sp.]
MTLTRQFRNVADIVLVTLLLLLLIEGVSYLAIQSYGVVKNEEEEASGRGSTGKENHGSEQQKVYAEQKQLQKYEYKAFIGWQATPARGETININSQRHRVTGFETAFPGQPTTHLFGGSTMWGTGVADSGTIAALLAPKISQNTINYGDKGYNSRQSLNRLIDNLENISEGDTVIFYDGVNDAMQNCRSNNSPDGHSRESQIKSLMEDVGEYDFMSNATALFRQTHTYTVLNRLLYRNDISIEKQRPNVATNCTDPETAEAVAHFLVKNWSAAEDILHARKIKFVCALQPNPYTATVFVPTYSNERRKSSVVSVYPLVQKLARAENLACFADMTEIFDRDYYLDHCCHVNREGNQAIADHLKIEMNKKRQYADLPAAAYSVPRLSETD